MGDIIHALPVAHDIRQALPEAELHWVAEESFRDIPTLAPAVSKVHVTAFRRWRKAILSGPVRAEMADVKNALRAEHYDVVLDIQGLMRSAMVARWAGVPATGYSWGTAREPIASLAYARKLDLPASLGAVRRYRMAAAEAAPSKADFDARYLYLRACTNTREVSRSLQKLAKLARDHVANRHRVGSNEITNDIGTLVADIRTLVNAREDHADVTALRNRAADVITRIEDLQRRLMEAQPRGSMTIRCCEFHLSYLLVLRELVNHYEIASLLEEQIDALARGAKAA